MVWLDNLFNGISGNPEPWIAAAVIAGGVAVFSGVAAEIVFRLLRPMAGAMEQETWNSLKIAFRKPLKVLVILIGIYWGLELLPLSDKADLARIRYMKSAFILTAAYGAFHLEALLATVFSRLDEKMNLQSSQLLKQFSLRIIRFVVAVLAVTLIAEEFGVNAASIVAGLGLAGLAVALAAQDTLANVFAGIVLIMDKPFDVGELIVVEGFTGTVENINFRSTRIRLLTQELVTIPNSAIAKGPITNLTRRTQRRAELKLELGKHARRDVLLAFIDELTLTFKGMAGIDPETVMVRLESVAVTGPVLQILFLTDTAEWDDFVAIRQEAVLALMEALDRHAISTARQRLQVEMGEVLS